MHRKDFVVIPTDSPFGFLIVDIVNAMEKPYAKQTCPSYTFTKKRKRRHGGGNWILAFSDEKTREQ